MLAIKQIFNTFPKITIQKMNVKCSKHLREALLKFSGILLPNVVHLENIHRAREMDQGFRARATFF